MSIDMKTRKSVIVFLSKPPFYQSLYKGKDPKSMEIEEDTPGIDDPVLRVAVFEAMKVVLLILLNSLRGLKPGQRRKPTILFQKKKRAWANAQEAILPWDYNPNKAARQNNLGGEIQSQGNLEDRFWPFCLSFSLFFIIILFISKSLEKIPQGFYFFQTPPFLKIGQNELNSTLEELFCVPSGTFYLGYDDKSSFSFLIYERKMVCSCWGTSQKLFEGKSVSQSQDDLMPSVNN